MSAQVVELVRYLVKGCAGESLDQSDVGQMGLADDRLFMLVNAEGNFVTQRARPPLAVVRPRLAGTRLALSAPGMDDLEFDIAYDGERHEVVLFGWITCKGIDQGTDVATWFSDYLG